MPHNFIRTVNFSIGVSMREGMGLYDKKKSNRRSFGMVLMALGMSVMVW